MSGLEYTVTRLASSRFRMNLTQKFGEQKGHMILECPSCALPFGLHAMGYAADQPFIVDGAGVGTAVPGVVMDLECLPINKRELFQRQFQNELIRWKLGDSESLLRIFSTMTMPASVKDRPSPEWETGPLKKAPAAFQYLGEINLQADAELAARRERQRELAEDQERRRTALAPAPMPDYYDDDSTVFGRVMKARKQARAKFGITTPEPERRKTADVIPIASKRRMFDDD